MKKNNVSQQGYLLVVAVIFMLVIGVMGSLIAYLFSNRAMLSAAQQNGLRAFYMAESGLQIGTRLLTMPNLSGTPARITCSGVTGNSAITHATMESGTFTMTATNSLPTFSVTTLSAPVTTTTSTINVTSTAGFASSGKILIDREAIDYAAISGDTFIGVTRGTSGTLASAHASGAGIGQYQCSLDVNAGIPNLTSPNYQRELQENVQLQDAWAEGNNSGNNFVLSRWNQPTEMSWNASVIAGGDSAGSLNGVSMLSNADGWAVGDEAQNNLIFLHWNGANWQLVTVAGCDNQNLLDISMVSSQQGWAVGTRYRPTNCNGGQNRYTILRWNGSSWSVLTPTSSPSIPADNNNNQNLNAIHVIDTTGSGLGSIGFAVGDNGRILQYSGANWTQAASPVTQNLNGVYTVSTNQAWAVGDNGVILHWDGSSWTSISSPTSTTLNNISMLDSDGDSLADFGVAVGNNGIIVTYNGSTWTSSDVGSTHLFGISIVNAQDAWIVGASGTAYHWNGSAWSNISLGANQQFNDISLISVKKNPTSGWRQVFH